MVAYCHLHCRNVLHELKESPFEELDSELLGLKWRAHPVALALALVFLESLNERNIKRLENYRKTLECLRDFDFISFPLAIQNAKMDGFYSGLKVIYDPSRLGYLPFQSFLQGLIAEGISIKESRIGHCEYRRKIFARGFDLWGDERGPIYGPLFDLKEY